MFEEVRQTLRVGDRILILLLLLLFFVLFGVTERGG
jgi:hypothetical protein